MEESDMLMRKMMIVFAIIVITMATGCGVNHNSSDMGNYQNTDQQTEAGVPATEPEQPGTGEPEGPIETGETADDSYIYQQGLEQIRKLDFNAALESFNQLPDDYEDAAVYKTALLGFIQYEAEAWLEAAISFTSLKEAINDKHPNWTLRSPNDPPYQKTITNPFLIKQEYDALIKKAGVLYQDVQYLQSEELLEWAAEVFFLQGLEQQGIPSASAQYQREQMDLQWIQQEILHDFQDADMPPLQYVEELFKRHLDNQYKDTHYYNYNYLVEPALFHYYYEQTLNGNNIAALATLPYKPGLNQPSYMSGLYAQLKQSLESILEEQGLKEYFYVTDASVSPVEVTGDKLYIIQESEKDEFGEHRHMYWGFQNNIAPCCMADKPEDIRYVLKFYESYTHTLDYNNNTKGYTTHITATVKDVVTGGILYSFKASAPPPQQVTGYGAGSYTYGKLQNTEGFITDILNALESLGIIIYRF